MNHLVGDGGDGKGLLDILETALLGEENAATLEPNVFVESGEFRKSGHFAYNKLRVSTSESKGKEHLRWGGPFLPNDKSISLRTSLQIFA